MTDDLNDHAGAGRRDGAVDEGLDAHIRAGLEALVGEAPEPPAPAGILATPVVPLHAHRRSVAWAAAAAVVVLIASIAAVAATRDAGSERVRSGDPTTTSTAPAVDVPLGGTTWTLSKATYAGGDPVSFDGDRPPTITFPRDLSCHEVCPTPYGPTTQWFDGCNWGATKMTAVGNAATEGAIVTPGQQTPSTDVACPTDPGQPAPISAVIDDIIQNPFAATIDHNFLTLTRTGSRPADASVSRLIFRARGRAGAASSDTLTTRPVFGTHWTLVNATDHGAPLTIRTNRGTPTVRFDDHWDCGASCSPAAGPAFFDSDGCNGSSGSMKVEGATFLPHGSGVSTLVKCTGTQIPPLGPGATTYEVTGDTLVLRGHDGRVLTYRADDQLFGPPDGVVVEQDALRDREGPLSEYQLTWEGPVGHSQVDLHRSVGGRSLPFVFVAIDPVGRSRVEASAASFGSHDLVFGVAPGEAARVVYEPAGGDPVDLALLPIDGYQAIRGLVPPGVTSWTITAYDADGGRIEQDRHAN